jgi:predicted O-methyltransferase YrrM
VASEVPLGGPQAAPSEPPPRGPHDPGTRAGRFHTVREPMALSGWLRYPAAWWRARRGETPERPWIVPAAIGYLRRRIRSDWSVLELGAGRSTPWFARRAGRVLSLEDNEFWADETRGRLRQLGLQTVDLRRLPVEDFAAEVDALADVSFDLVVVDFLEAPTVTRIDVLKPALRKVRPGGLLLLDDSDRPGYSEAFELLEGWRFRKFVGVKDGWPEACETGIFRRPN